MSSIRTAGTRRRSPWLSRGRSWCFGHSRRAQLRAYVPSGGTDHIFEHSLEKRLDCPIAEWIAPHRSSLTLDSKATHDESRGRAAMNVNQPAFNELFDRAVAACAEAQRLSGRTAESVRRARIERASARRLKSLISETRD